MGRGFLVMAGSSPGRRVPAVRGVPAGAPAASGRGRGPDVWGGVAAGEEAAFSRRFFGRFPEGDGAVAALFFGKEPDAGGVRPASRPLLSCFKSGCLTAGLCGSGRAAFRASDFAVCPERLFCRGGRSGLGGISNTCMG